YEGANVHHVKIQVSDGTNVTTGSVTLVLDDVEEAPTDLALSATTITDVSVVGDVVGFLSAYDPDYPDDPYSPFNQWTLLDNADGQYKIESVFNPDTGR